MQYNLGFPPRLTTNPNQTQILIQTKQITALQYEIIHIEIIH